MGTVKKIKRHRLPCGSADKESACNAGSLGLINGLGRLSGEGKSFLLQCSGLENSMDYILHGVAKSQTELSDFHLGAEGPHCSMMCPVLETENDHEL